jgi:hypothetical protein
LESSDASAHGLVSSSRYSGTLPANRQFTRGKLAVKTLSTAYQLIEEEKLRAAPEKDTSLALQADSYCSKRTK